VIAAMSWLHPELYVLFHNLSGEMITAQRVLKLIGTPHRHVEPRNIVQQGRMFIISLEFKRVVPSA
jgi:hypothetical protein